jgi:hypothetical protein
LLVHPSQLSVRRCESLIGDTRLFGCPTGYHICLFAERDDYNVDFEGQRIGMCHKEHGIVLGIWVAFAADRYSRRPILRDTISDPVST